MTGLYKAALIVHIFSAMIWVGGVLFIGMIAVPATRKLPVGLRRQLMTDLGNRFRTVGWTALVLLIISGSYMMYFWGARWGNLLDLSFFTAPHTATLGKKLILVGLMLAASGVHDWYLGPLASREGHTPEAAERYRKIASWLGRVTAILVLGIVVLAIFVARPWV
ncbi:MAG: copper resistance protein CopD [Bradymonadaceae bacterium]